jgi:hypothetical protein
MTTTITGATGIDNIKAATGAVLQVVTGTYATITNIATATYTDLGLSATITPTSTSSKILVMWTIQSKLSNATELGWGCKLLRNTTAVYTDTTNYRTYGDVNTGDIRSTTPISHLDSPSTTSAIAYKIQVSTYDGNSLTFNDANNKTQITLMEIAG